MIFLYTLFGAVGLAVIILFSIQNAAPVTVWFYNWKFDASLAIVVFLSAIAGMLIEGLIVGSLRLRKTVRARNQKRGEAAGRQSRPDQETPGETPRP
jgi:uncharacterized integral membrane protein